MRPVALVVLVCAALLSVTVVALTAWQGSDGPVQAQPALVVGLDMNPTGNSCPGSGTDCSLGTIDACRAVSAGGTIDFDVYLDGLPSGEDLTGFQYSIDGWPGTITAQIHNTPAINVMARNAQSNVTDFGEGAPDASAPHVIAEGDINPTTIPEKNPPYTKGVLGRYTIDTTGVPSGVYGLTLSAAVIPNSMTPTPDDLCTKYGCDIHDSTYNDGSTYYGLLAVDVLCGTAPTTPTATPSATPTPAASATPTPTVSPTPGPTTLNLATGWNHVCYLEADRPISDALADLEPSVVAAYRLRPDQTYDRWFPGRPDVSTITTARAYEPLFLLMASDIAWPQEPGVAPTSLALTVAWNSVCYSGQAKDIESATGSIAGRFGVLYLLASNQSWQRFVPGRPEISNLPSLQQFAAVVVVVTQPDSHWIFDP